MAPRHYAVFGSGVERQKLGRPYASTATEPPSRRSPSEPASRGPFRVHLSQPSWLTPQLCSVASPVLWNCPTRHHRASRPYPFGFSVRTLGKNTPRANGGASRVPYKMFPCMPGVSDPAGPVYASPYRRNRVAFRVLGARRHPASTLISGLNIVPARSPVNASPQPSPTTAHDSGPVWLAKPSLSETFTPSHHAGFPGAPQR